MGCCNKYGPYILAFFGLVFIIVGSVLPGALKDSVEKGIRKLTVFTEGSDALEDFEEPNVYGAAFGGSADTDDDNGIEYNLYVANITNIDEVLHGAVPIVGEYKVELRKYTENLDVELNGDETELSFLPMTTYVFQTSDEELAAANLYVPNFAYLQAVGQVDAIHNTYMQFAGAGLLPSDDALDVDPMDTPEDALSPIAVASFFVEAPALVEGALRLSWLPVHLAGAVAGWYTTAGGVDVTTQAAFASAMTDATYGNMGGSLGFLDFDTSDVDFQDTVTGIAGSSFDVATDSMDATVVVTLFSDDTTSGVNLLDSTAYQTVWVPFLTAANGDDAAFVGAMGNAATAIATAFGATDNRYADLSTGQVLATKHALQILFYLSNYLDVGGTDAKPASLEATVVGQLNAQGYGLAAPYDNFKGVVAAQMTHASPMTVLGDIAANGGPTSASTYANAFLCVNGASLAELAPDDIPVPIELGCVTKRGQDGFDFLMDPTGAAGTAPVYTGTTIHPIGMAAVIDKLVNGPAMYATLSAMDENIPDLPAGSRHARLIAGRAKAVLRERPLLDAARTDLSNKWAAVIQYDPVTESSDWTSAYTSWATAHGTYTANTADYHHSLCNMTAEFDGFSELDLDCFQLLDLAAWLDHTARAFVYYPNLVWNSIPADDRLEDEAGNVPGMDASNLASGPFVKLSARQMLKTGWRETLLHDGLGITLVDGYYKNWADEQDFRDSGRGNDTIRTGKGDVDETYTIKQFDGSTTRDDWGAGNTVTVEGSYDGLRYPPKLDVNVGEEDVPDRVTMWFSQGVRTLSLTKSAEVDGPAGHIEGLARYTLENEASAEDLTGTSGLTPFEKYDSDSPDCMMALRKDLIYSITNFADEPTMFDIYASQPHMGFCPDNVADLSVSGLDFSASEHQSYIDVDWTSGVVLNGAKRIALYIKMRSSEWHPNLGATTAATTGVTGTTTPPADAPGSTYNYWYHPFMWIEETNSIQEDDEKTLSALYKGIRAGIVAAPTVGAILGVLFIAIALWKLRKRSKEGGAGAPKTAAGENEVVQVHVSGSNPMRS